MREIIENIMLAIILVLGCNKMYETIYNVTKKTVEILKKKREKE